MHFRRQKDILLTLQERCSRLTLAGRLHSKDATDTADAIIDQLAALPSDRGPDHHLRQWRGVRPASAG